MANSAADLITAPQSNSVTNAVLADMLAPSLKGRYTAGTGDPEDLTPNQALSVLGVVTRGSIDGLITSRPSTTTVTVAAGAARDSTDATTIVLAASVTKTLQTSGAWTAGTGNNGLDTGARTASNTYHVFVISNAAGTLTDVIVSLSATSPTMPTGYTLKRRVASVVVGSANTIFDYVQYGDTFLWLSPFLDVNATNPGTAAVTRSLSAPTGVVVEAIMGVALINANATADMPASVYISALALTDNAAAQAQYMSVLSYVTQANAQVGALVRCFTNTSAQVRSRLQISAAGTILLIGTHGWVDARGKNA